MNETKLEMIDNSLANVRSFIEAAREGKLSPASLVEWGNIKIAEIDAIRRELKSEVRK